MAEALKYKTFAVVACGSCGCSWSFSVGIRFWAVPVSWSNELHSVIVCCVTILFPLMDSVNVWRNSCSICWCRTCSVDRELQQAWLREGDNLGTSSKSTQSLKRTWRKILSTVLGTAAVGKEEYPIYILNIVISFFPDARLEKSFVAKLHFKHIYHLAFHFHECSSCRAGGGIWRRTMWGEPCLLPASFHSLKNACYALVFNIS